VALQPVRVQAGPGRHRSDGGATDPAVRSAGTSLQPLEPHGSTRAPVRRASASVPGRSAARPRPPRRTIASRRAPRSSATRRTPGRRRGPTSTPPSSCGRRAQEAPERDHGPGTRSRRRLRCRARFQLPSSHGVAQRQPRRARPCAVHDRHSSAVFSGEASGRDDTASGRPDPQRPSVAPLQPGHGAVQDPAGLSARTGRGLTDQRCSTRCASRGQAGRCRAGFVHATSPGHPACPGPVYQLAGGGLV